MRPWIGGSVELDFEIVDTHLHLWDPARLRYPWLDAVPFLNRPFLLPDYYRACGEVAVGKMVFVQCECLPAQSRQELAWVAELAGIDPRIEGIVPWAPLEKGGMVENELEALSRNPLVKGVRRLIQSETDPEFCLRPDFIRGVRLLPRFGLSFAIGAVPHQLPAVVRLVEQCPEVRFALDHIGKPCIREGLMEPWKTALRALSQFPNVYCKVSSLATEADHRRWTPAQLRPYVNHVFDCFGFERTFFGGDWPVSTQAATFPVCVSTLAHFLRGATKAELRKVFRDNAIQFYRLRGATSS